MDIVVKKEGEYIVGTKENTAKRLESAKQVLPPFSTEAEKGHGRIENRHYSTACISPVSAGLIGAQSATMVRREWLYINEENAKTQCHDRYFLTSIAPDQGLVIASDVRGHWSIENKNHYKKDTCFWREDDHRHRRVNAAQKLALLRSALMAIIPFDDTQTLGDCLDQYRDQPQLAIKLIQNAHPV